MQKNYEIDEPRNNQSYIVTLTNNDEKSISFVVVNKSNEKDVYELSNYVLREFHDKNKIYTYFSSISRIYNELCSIIELGNFDFIADEGILKFTHINQFNQSVEIEFELRFIPYSEYFSYSLYKLERELNGIREVVKIKSRIGMASLTDENITYYDQLPFTMDIDRIRQGEGAQPFRQTRHRSQATAQLGWTQPRRGTL